MAYRTFNGLGYRLALLALAAIVAACSKFYSGPPSEAEVKAHLPEHYQKDAKVLRIHAPDSSKCPPAFEIDVFPVLISYTNVRNNPPCPFGKPRNLFDTCGSGTTPGALAGLCFWRKDGSWVAQVSSPDYNFYQDWK